MKNRGFISTPLYVYIIILIISTVLIFVSYHFENGNWWQGFLLNFGCGGLASLVVSAIIDNGNTRRSRTESKSKYDIITRECTNCCIILRDCVKDKEEERYDLSGSMTYKEYVKEALNPEYEPNEMDDDYYFNFLYDVVYTITKIKSACDKLLGIIPVCYDVYLNSNLYKNVKSLSSQCRRIEILFDRKQYNRCVDNIERLDDLIIITFPDLKQAFKAPYIRDYDEEDEK